jgi:hypothetical protein
MTQSASADFQRIIEAAREHYQNLKTDIENAKDRVEHIRLTALAQEAFNLLTELEMFEIGLVYTRIQSLGPTELEKYMQLRQEIVREKSELREDLPEFKSPFDPRHHVQ